MNRNLSSWTSKLTAALVLTVALLFGLAQTAIAATSHNQTVRIQGRHRTFLLFAPEGGARRGRLPILIVLHGGLGNGRRVAEQTRLANYVDPLGILAIFPDAGRRQWNDGRKTTDNTVDDVAFLRAVIRISVQNWGGDPSRVFVVGVSNGGMMAQRMACEAADVVTAVGAVVANMPEHLAARCRPFRPIPVVLINGTDDRLMPWNGGVIKSSRILGGAGGKVLSALETFDLWSTFDGCRRPEVSDLSGIPVKRHTSSDCRSGTQVVLYEIDGGGHGWPGGHDLRGPIARLILGHWTNVVSASSIVIQFFKRYGL